jgi:hypothetical protein
MAGSWGCSWAQAWGNAWGDTSDCAAAPQPDVGIPPGGGKGLDRRESYLSWWERELRRIIDARRKKKKLAPKKRELVEELDETLDELRAQVVERQETDAYARKLREQVLASARLMNEAYAAQVTNARIRREIAIIQEYLRELDDEEAIILAIH